MEERSRAAAGTRSEGGTLALVLAGGSGTRLGGLTEWRAKPAVPFGGHYRTVDFTLSNCVNSGLRRIALLTQYKSQSLIRHIQESWGFARRELDEFIEIWPAQQRRSERWYLGTVDAVHQNLDLIEAVNPEHILVLAGDHVYAMDYGALLAEHVMNRADATVGCVEVPIEEAQSFGIVGIERDRRVRSFIEKPERPMAAPDRRGVTLASMGIYVFNRSFLFERLERDAGDADSTHDFGYSLLPSMIANARVFSYSFRDCRDPRLPGYWRDVGTIDAYWAAHMDLLDDPPRIDLYDARWPMRGERANQAPARVTGAVRISSSIIARGSTVAGDVHRSVVSTDCRIGAHSRIVDSVLLPGCRVGRNCLLERVVVDDHCVIPDNTVIGAGLADSVKGKYQVSPLGIVLVPADAHGAHPRAIAAARKVA